MSKVKRSLPVVFTPMKKFETEDIRFLKVVIDVMHTGENLNGSHFTKDVIDANIDSIKGTPILGYISTEDEMDFEGHEFALVKNADGSVEYKYYGHSYGYIPEDCNPRWYSKECDDGVTREFLQVDGIMWTKFTDAMDIFMRDETKSQSVELVDCEGEEGEDGLFHFTSFKFDGCCILSSTDPYIKPAMVGANVSANFTTSVAGEIKRMLSTYEALDESQFITFEQEMKGVSMENDIVNENVETQVEETKQETPEVTEVFENTEVVEENTNTEEVVDETVEEDVTEETEDTVENFEEETNETDNSEEKFEETQTIKREELYQLLDYAVNSAEPCEDEDCGYYYSRFYMVDFTENEVIVCDRANDYALCGIQYEVNGNSVSLKMETLKAKAIAYVDVEEKVEEAFTKVFTKYDQAVAEVKTMKPIYEAYMAEKEAEEKQRVLEEKEFVIKKYEDFLKDNEEFNAIKNELDKYSVDELTLKVATLFCKTRTYDDNDKFFSQQKNNTALKVNEEDDAKPSSFYLRYGVEKVTK